MNQQEFTRELRFETTPNIQSIYEHLRMGSINMSKDKRNFELLIAQAISNCDYKRLQILVSKSFSNNKTIKFDNLPLIYYTIGVITLLTRLAIIDGVSEKDAYSLSDAYLTLDFSKIKTPALEVIMEIVFNFVKLIQNAKYFKYDSLVVTHAINHIHNNLNLKLTLKDLSDFCQVSPEHLSSHFKKITGMTIKNFINNEKVNYAKLLLTTTDLSQLDIALELGYSNQSYFSNIFKKYTKETPAQYRKKGVVKLSQQTLKENF